MGIIVKGTAELPQAFVILLIIFLTFGIVFGGAGILLDFLQGSIWIILLLLLCDIVVVALYINTRKKLLWIVKEREELDTGKTLPKVVDKSLWSRPGMIYLLRLGWIPIGIAVIWGWYLFVDSNDRLTPTLIAFVIFVIYAILAVRYLEKKK